MNLKLKASSALHRSAVLHASIAIFQRINLIPTTLVTRLLHPRMRILDLNASMTIPREDAIMTTKKVVSNQSATTERKVAINIKRAVTVKRDMQDATMTLNLVEELTKDVVEVMKDVPTTEKVAIEKHREITIRELAVRDLLKNNITEMKIKRDQQEEVPLVILT
jgi:hypothetical protein